MDIYFGLYKWGIRVGLLGRRFEYCYKLVNSRLDPIPIFFRFWVGKKYKFSGSRTGVSKGELIIQLFGWEFYKDYKGICYHDFAEARDNGTITKEEIA